MAEWSGALVSIPAICRLRVEFPSTLVHATLPTTGVSVTETQIYMAVNEMLVQDTGLWSEIGLVVDQIF